ncbi:MAG: hypothetical protein ACI8QS_001080, partial [Planctomycetota bacterium]
PDWVLQLDPEAQDVSLGSFAWNENEARLLRHNRSIKSRNTAFIEGDAKSATEVDVEREEVRQVRVTNDYRVLLGLRALGWNPDIQEAAWDHSDYMSRTGDFGHVEPTPGREGFSDRLRRRGYNAAGGENCYRGSGDADMVHQAWLHSPGHHRNIIATGHTEMAAARIGAYWTQVFGRDSEFFDDL